MEDEKKCRVGGMYEAIYLRGKALDYSLVAPPLRRWLQLGLADMAAIASQCSGFLGETIVSVFRSLSD